MTRDDRQKLRTAALTAVNATRAKLLHFHGAATRDWELQTSNSFRRIGAHGDGDILCATTHPVDRHPDLLAPSGVLDYIVASQPRVVLELLDLIDVLEAQRSDLIRDLAGDAEALTELATAIASCPPALANLSRALGIEVIDVACEGEEAL